MIDVKNVGLFIAECRKSKNWTQKQLGEKLGVTDRAVSKWETGRSLPDICLMENICELFDLQVSELLAGKKIEEEEYKKETEKMLIKTIGENQLYGFQIVLYLLEFSALLMFYIPFFLNNGSFFPVRSLENILCWIIAALVTCCTIYLDKKLPARRYRTSNVWIETLNGIGAFLLVAFYILYSSGVTDMTGEQIRFLAKWVLAGVAIIAVTNILMVRSRRE